MSAAVEAELKAYRPLAFFIRFQLGCRFFQAKTYTEYCGLRKSYSKRNCIECKHSELPAEEIKGIKVCKQANAKWEESFDERVNPHGKKYYWLSGYFNNMDKSEDADETALQGYISVVPVKFDLQLTNI
jgi:5'-nucleotidase